jgi:fructose-specific component phosphotransferase system IIB-like protein
MAIIDKVSSFCFILCLVALGASVQAMDQGWHDKQYITDSFVTIALRREYETNAKNDIVRKWHKPIRVYIESKVGNSALQKEMVSVQLKHLSSITQHSIGLVNAKDEANVVIVFILKADMESSIKAKGPYITDVDAALKGAACLSSVKSTSTGELLSAGIYIPVDSTRSAGKLVNCVVEEITQIMGLFNDSPKVYPSIFNDQSIEVYLSGLDYILLKLLYDPGIASGMREQRVRRIVLKMLAKYEQEGLIENASANVLLHSMSRWSEKEN